MFFVRSEDYYYYFGFILLSTKDRLTLREHLMIVDSLPVTDNLEPLRPTAKESVWKINMQSQD